MVGKKLLLKLQIVVLYKKIGFLRNLSLIVVLSLCHQSPYNSRVDTVMNDAKFRVYMSNSFGKVNVI